MAGEGDDYLDTVERLETLLGTRPKILQGEYTSGEFTVDGKQTKVFASGARFKAGGNVRLFASNRGMDGRVSDDGLSATYCCAGTSSTVRANRSYMAGRWYFEGQLQAPEGNADGWMTIGAVPTSQGLYPILLASRTEMIDMGYGFASNQLKDGDTIGIAIDIDNGKIFFSGNGVWANGDPARGQDGAEIKPKRDYVAAVTVGSPGRARPSDQWTVNFGSKRFTFQVPAGFRAYTAGPVAP